MNFDVNNVNDIEALHNYVQSKGNSLNTRELRSLLSLVRSSTCHRSKKVSLQQLRETEERLEKFIKEKTPWYRTPAFYIAVFVAILAAVLKYVSNSKEAEAPQESTALNQAMQPTANFAHFLRGRSAPIFAQKAHKIGRV